MKLILILALTAISISAFSQKTSPYEKFGKVTKSDLERQVYPIDSSANAVILAAIGETSIEGNNKSSFSLRTKIHRVVHILSEKGYKEADVEIRLYGSGSNAEELNNLKAVTYNLENGKVIESKVSKSSLVKDKLDENYKVSKFTMPNVRKGSIIEYSYEVVSPYISQPDPWYFQSLTAPTLWSEFRFETPEFFNYRSFFRGFLKIDIADNSKKSKAFRVSDSYSSTSTDAVSFNSNVLISRWVAENAPELKTEPFTKSIRNHIGRIEFQLVSQGYPLSIRNFTNTWQDIAKNMLESPRFGKNLNTSNNWMKDDLQQITGTETDPLEKAKKIFRYVQNDFKTTDQSGIYMSDNLKNIFKSKQGSPTELNVLLTSMLRYINLDAKPLMLSTSSHGYAMEMAPMISSMNYIICGVMINDKKYYLDASNNKIGFGKLPEYCYNGLAISIDPIVETFNLNSDELEDKALLTYNFFNTDDGYNGTMTKTKGYYTSLDIREDYTEKEKEKMIEDLRKSFGDNFEVTNFKVDSLENFEEPVKISFQLKMNQTDDDIIYFNPFADENYKQNPFASAERNYLVEFPYKSRELIRGTFQVPNGYKIDEMPKPVKVLLDEDGKSYFNYQISASGGTISFVSDFKIDKTFFMPEEYNVLREFFDYVVKKESEQIVFKKIAE